MQILIVEDEQKVAEFLRQALTETGYTVDVALDGAEGLHLAQAADFGLIVLDRMLPQMNGLDLCRTLRNIGDETPILMITARDALEDKVLGLDSGADDYLTKPFSIDELLARVRALLRRHTGGKTAAILSVEDLTLDTLTRRARRGEAEFELSSREYALLDYLMRNAHRPVTRAMIAEHVWGFDFDSGSNVIDVYVSYLRRKIDSSMDHKLIRTLRHIGYQIG
ncbi:MAG: response regulator transcription factor [Janthinobacterium lividum]